LNRIPGWIDAVTPADLQRVARTYLTTPNRVVIDRVPAAMAAARQPAEAAKKE
jgi:predicted Zn-dependent peptidase